MRANRHSAADYLTLAAGYGREIVERRADDVTERLGFIHEYLTTDATRGRFEAFVRTMLRPLFGQLGFSPCTPSGTTTNRRALRAVVSARSARSGTTRTSFASRGRRSTARWPETEPTRSTRR